MNDSISILLVFDKRPDDLEIHDRRADRWIDAVTTLGVLAGHNKGIQILGENVLLLLLKEGLQGVADVVRLLAGLKYKYAILSEEIKWYGVEVV